MCVCLCVCVCVCVCVRVCVCVLLPLQATKHPKRGTNSFNAVYEFKMRYMQWRRQDLEEGGAER